MSVDWGIAGEPVEYYGNYQSCKIRNTALLEDDVLPFDYDVKIIAATKVYA